MDLIYSFVRSDIVWVCLAIFIIGMVFQYLRFKKISTIAPPPIRVPLPKGVTLQKPKLFSEPWFRNKVVRIRTSLFGIHPVMAIVTVSFHVLWFLLPLFLLEHAVLYLFNFHINIMPFTIPPLVANILCIYVILCGVYFLSRRIFVNRVRAITTIYDYIVLALALTPFLTGFFMINQLAPPQVNPLEFYKWMTIFHIGSFELLLLLFPFSKFAHMIYRFTGLIFLKMRNRENRPEIYSKNIIKLKEVAVLSN